MRVVVALGGNALLRRGEPADAEAQRHNITVAVDGLAELTGSHELVVTHGNGPQVGCSPCRATPTPRSRRTRWTWPFTTTSSP